MRAIRVRTTLAPFWGATMQRRRTRGLGVGEGVAQDLGRGRSCGRRQSHEERCAERGGEQPAALRPVLWWCVLRVSCGDV